MTYFSCAGTGAEVEAGTSTRAKTGIGAEVETGTSRSRYGCEQNQRQGHVQKQRHKQMH